jgi:predicted nucleotidyltransferase
MGTKQKQVADWLFPKARRKVLALLLMDRGRRWHLRQIVRRTGCGIGSVRRELAGLTAAGILTRTRDGNRTCYQADTNCPVHMELAGIIRKTCGLADVLRDALRGLGPRVRVAFIYGSQARADAASGSDVDLMVIGEAGFGEVVNALADAQDTLAREINPTVYSAAEFRDKVAAGHHFLRTVLNEPRIFLIGDADELAGLAE